jgi:Ion channel
MILGTFVFVMAAPDSTWALSVLALLLAVTLVLAIWTSGLGFNASRTLVVLAIGLGIAVLVQTVAGDTAAGTAWLVGLLLAGVIMTVVALGVVDQGEVNSQSVVGAICVYLMLGLLFSFAYASAAKFGSGYFFAQGTDGTPAIRLYFSYITMATVGYGDYTAAGDFGRTLAVVEGLLGQLYLVTVVALLVSRLGLRPGRSG